MSCAGDCSWCNSGLVGLKIAGTVFALIDADATNKKERPSQRPYKHSCADKAQRQIKGMGVRQALFLLWAAGISAGPAAASYPTRCDDLRALLGGNLVACWDFENPEDALLQEPGDPRSEYRPAVTIDPNMSASGNSSLRFETISFNEAKRRNPELTDEEALTVARRSNTSWWAAISRLIGRYSSALAKNSGFRCGCGRTMLSMRARGAETDLRSGFSALGTAGWISLGTERAVACDGWQGSAHQARWRRSSIAHAKGRQDKDWC